MNIRNNHIYKLKNEKFDIVVIGGGITGAGIALTAARKGWKTLIIDKADFASGTSSRSAKLIHGGLRYLQQLQIKLVREALHEREHLLSEYPHLIKPQPFFMPIYKSRLNKLKYYIGLSGYDYLSGETSLPKHNSLEIDEVKDKFPQIKTDDMIGGYIYYDAKTNDARLTNEVIQQATELGAIAINYLTLQNFITNNNQVTSIECLDILNNQLINIRSKVFVNATGIWTDETLRKFNPNDTQQYMAPSKGIHLIVSNDHLPKDCVLLFPTTNNDGRMLWCIPWEENLNIVGTTDTDYNQSLDTIWTEKEEIDYILNSLNAQLKNKQLSYDDILSVYAGLRPLLNDNDESKKSNQRSRDYNIWWNNDNLLTISGGKLTSFLSMAENTILTITEKHIISSKQNEEVVLESLIDQFKNKYGIKNASLIAAIIQENESYLQTITDFNYTIAEVLFFIRHQHAVRLTDVLTRRTIISYAMQQWNEALINSIVSIMQKELHWTEEQVANEIEHYKKEWQIMHSWK
ncbi:MAG: glycerol-3-phosphate dehydrogenase/oxidase [Chitinophagales bacterium]|nr:glycerol-3-phosphate dehydrogenase/oxidase [Chitinophagales bacterium]